MLSILIPVYNYDVTRLVKALGEQCRDAGIPYEIICMDDHSDMFFAKQNASLKDLPGVRWERLERNIGRSGIRNVLARQAQYKSLLYLDCDSGIISESYITAYLQHIDKDVVSGGRVYHPCPPSDDDLFLHWKYGVQRESMPPPQRQRHPYMYFHTNNFLIQKHIVSVVPFDESFKGYGYEDIEMGRGIVETGYVIKHIDNPVRHDGLEGRDRFIAKTIESIQNLAARSVRVNPPETRLSRTAYKIRRCGLQTFFLFIFRAMKPLVLSHLHSRRPLLRVLDFFKLGTYLAEIKAHESRLS